MKFPTQDQTEEIMVERFKSALSMIVATRKLNSRKEFDDLHVGYSFSARVWSGYTKRIPSGLLYLMVNYYNVNPLFILKGEEPVLLTEAERSKEDALLEGMTKLKTVVTKLSKEVMDIKADVYKGKPDKTASKTASKRGKKQVKSKR